MYHSHHSQVMYQCAGTNDSIDSKVENYFRLNPLSRYKYRFTRFRCVSLISDDRYPTHISNLCFIHRFWKIRYPIKIIIFILNNLWIFPVFWRILVQEWFKLLEPCIHVLLVRKH